MKKQALLLAGATVLAFSASPALATCSDEIAMLSSGSQAGGQATGSTTSGTEEQAGAISKDGSLAPLETPNDGSAAGQSAASGSASADATTGTTSSGATGTTTQSVDSGAGSATTGDPAAGAGEVAKDGQTMPLAQEQGGGPAETAMSGQDAVSQQEGGQTAAAEAGQGNVGGGTNNGASGGTEFMAALDRARTLQQQGDEAGCMDAVEEARRLQGG